MLVHVKTGTLMLLYAKKKFYFKKIFQLHPVPIATLSLVDQVAMTWLAVAD
jgi:hypothetical protein